MKKLLTCAVVVLSLTGMAMAVSFDVPALTTASAGQTIVVPVSAVGQGNLQGFNLTLEVQGPLEIVGMSLTPGLFQTKNTGLQLTTFANGAPSAQVAMANTTTDSGTVAAPGILANVSILIPAGTPNGDYFFRTEIPDFGFASDFAGSAGVNVDAQGSGFIRVPEPASALLLLGALPLLRRRHA